MNRLADIQKIGKRLHPGLACRTHLLSVEHGTNLTDEESI